ncbi:MAG: hypothetical protein HLUCCO02_07460 [Idiomarinaceae bacterium HL-53]|nr:MAG: hypothetical protein HLUCCO02_07460 [Idiomarinaceae bacterium HL-53]CUS47193.1 hypothetical protein Ga0003345_0119 [Idiomarinaceae bacterium HL-53]
MTEQTIAAQVAAIKALQQEIDTLFEDPEDTRETIAAILETHEKRLQGLFADLGGTEPDAETRAFLENTQEKIAQWTKQAVREREETKKILLELAQGRKARKSY